MKPVLALSTLLHTVHKFANVVAKWSHEKGKIAQKGLYAKIKNWHKFDIFITPFFSIE
jgi:hypothetical protein